MFIGRRTLSVLVITIAMTSAIHVRTVAEEVVTPARDWLERTPVEQLNYVGGFLLGRRVGAEMALTVFMSHGVEHPKVGAAVKEVRDSCLFDSPKLVAEAVTKFYRDPANTYVEMWDAADISILTMRGKQVDIRVREARKAGYESFMAAKAR